MSRERDGSDDRDNSKSSSRHHDYLVKLRGISSSSTKDTIKKFLSPCHVVNVHLFDNNGTLSSECFVDLESDIDVKDALKKSGSHLDNKNIEVTRATSYEYSFHAKHNGKVSWHEPVIRMSGLPFSCTMADIQHFFQNIEIARNGIYITRDMADQALGDGFVAFVSMDNAYKAIDMHDQKHIQHRYIELFPSTYDEAKRRILNDARSNAKQFVGEEDDDNHKMDDTNDDNNNNNNSITKLSSPSRSRQRTRSASRDSHPRETKRRRSPTPSPPPRSRPPPKSSNRRSDDGYRRRSRSRSPIRGSSSRSEEHLVKIRGMPFNVVEDDVRKFFPSSCQPKRIEIVQDRRMKRPNGDGHLYFSSLDEVTEALKYDRKYMGSRYVELYFDSPRYASLNIRRKKPEDAPRRSSRSPSKPRNSRFSRSRSESSD